MGYFQILIVILDSLGYVFVVDSMGSYFDHLDVIRPISLEFAKMTQNNALYHSRSPILIQMESYNSYWLIINTNLHTISHRFPVIADY